MSARCELELESALGELDAALRTEQLDLAFAALPRVLALCAELRGAGEKGGDRFTDLRDLADSALRRAQALQWLVGERLQAAGASRTALERYAGSRRAA